MPNGHGTCEHFYKLNVTLNTVSSRQPWWLIVAVRVLIGVFCSTTRSRPSIAPFLRLHLALPMPLNPLVGPGLMVRELVGRSELEKGLVNDVTPLPGGAHSLNHPLPLIFIAPFTPSI